MFVVVLCSVFDFEHRNVLRRPVITGGVTLPFELSVSEKFFPQS